jgi:hypothetical protein
VDVLTNKARRGGAVVDRSYEVVLVGPGGSDYTWVPVAGIPEGIERAQQWLDAFKPGETAGREAWVRCKRRGALLDRWSECWPNKGPT